ncbi:hypothetical protein NHF46_23520 [Arthrobacter alpinus]|nr:hypothetical protein [Arthrobacter alpinus]
MATCSGERGAGTMLAAGIALAMLMLMVLVLGLATAAVAAGRAATAADLAALAAADAHRGSVPEIRVRSLRTWRPRTRPLWWNVLCLLGAIRCRVSEHRNGATLAGLRSGQSWAAAG